jgi:hypothetical protein
LPCLRRLNPRRHIALDALAQGNIYRKKQRRA